MCAVHEKGDSGGYLGFLSSVECSNKCIDTYDDIYKGVCAPIDIDSFKWKCRCILNDKRRTKNYYKLLTICRTSFFYPADTCYKTVVDSDGQPMPSNF